MVNLKYIRKLIGEAKLIEALDSLLGILESSDRKSRKLRDDVIILRSKLEEIIRQESLNLTSPENLTQREKLRLRMRYLG